MSFMSTPEVGTRSSRGRRLPFPVQPTQLWGQFYRCLPSMRRGLSCIPRGEARMRGCPGMP